MEKNYSSVIGFQKLHTTVRDSFLTQYNQSTQNSNIQLAGGSTESLYRVIQHMSTRKNWQLMVAFESLLRSLTMLTTALRYRNEAHGGLSVGKEVGRPWLIGSAEWPYTLSFSYTIYNTRQIQNLKRRCWFISKAGLYRSHPSEKLKDGFSTLIIWNCIAN